MGKERRTGEHDRCERDRCDHRSNVGFEEVSAHSRDIANVVTNVIRDRCGVPWVILGDACFDLPDEVGAHIRRLGVDTTSDTGEQSDRRRSQPDRRNDLHPLRRPSWSEGSVEPKDITEEEEAKCESEQTETSDGETHNGTTTEGHGQCLSGTTEAGSLSSTGVGRCCHTHADEPREG